jgi:hypothetical protein
MHNDGIHSFHVLKEEVLKRVSKSMITFQFFFPLEIRKHQDLQAQSKLAMTTIQMFMFVNPCPLRAQSKLVMTTTQMFMFVNPCPLHAHSQFP